MEKEATRDVLFNAKRQKKKSTFETDCVFQEH